jgi:polar amino acid transport system permease protein
VSYDFSWLVVERALPKLLDGLWVSLELTAWANLIGLTAGFVLAFCTISRWAPLRFLAVSYIEIFRCTPALIQLMWFYFCVPMIFDVWWSAEFMGILALGMNLTAFNAEAYRAAIQTVPSSHLDASVALGLGKLKTIIYVILPQALMIAIPVLVTNGIGIFQQSALVALISVEDLMYQGRILSSQTFRPIEILSTVAVFYLAVAIPLSQVVSFLERRTALMLSR